jgi:hypothetical protein
MGVYAEEEKKEERKEAGVIQKSLLSSRHVHANYVPFCIITVFLVTGSCRALKMAR